MRQGQIERLGKTHLETSFPGGNLFICHGIFKSCEFLSKWLNLPIFDHPIPLKPEFWGWQGGFQTFSHDLDTTIRWRLKTNDISSVSISNLPVHKIKKV